MAAKTSTTPTPDTTTDNPNRSAPMPLLTLEAAKDKYETLSHRIETIEANIKTAHSGLVAIWREVAEAEYAVSTSPKESAAKAQERLKLANIANGDACAALEDYFEQAAAVRAEMAAFATTELTTEIKQHLGILVAKQWVHSNIAALIERKRAQLTEIQEPELSKEDLAAAIELGEITREEADSRVTHRNTAAASKADLEAAIKGLEKRQSTAREDMEAARKELDLKITVFNRWRMGEVREDANRAIEAGAVRSKSLAGLFRPSAPAATASA
jgi:hypothetical protein